MFPGMLDDFFCARDLPSIDCDREYAQFAAIFECLRRINDNPDGAKNSWELTNVQTKIIVCIEFSTPKTNFRLTEVVVKLINFVKHSLQVLTRAAIRQTGQWGYPDQT